MSSLLNNMYNKTPISKQPSTKSSEDAISISSDESQDTSGAEVRWMANSSSRSNFKSVNFDPAPSLVSEVRSSRESQSINAGQTRSEKDYSEETPAKKKMTYHEASIDEPRPQNGQICNDSEKVFSNTFTITNAKPKPQRKPKPKQKPMKSYKKYIKLENSVLKFQNLAGIDRILTNLCQILIHVKTPEAYRILGVQPPNGILLYGPTGSGKTCLAYAIAGQLGIPIVNVPATELIAGITGESEERIRDIFEQAANAAPCVLFIDEVEAISSSRSNALKDMERRVVAQLISCMDNLNKSGNGNTVLIIGATSRPDALDSALRRAGRFDYEIGIPIPNQKERREILHLMCTGLQIEPHFDYDLIAELTPGYVGADISSMVSRASLFAVKRKFLEEYYIQEDSKDVVEGANDLTSSKEPSVPQSSNYSSGCIPLIPPTTPIEIISIDDETVDKESSNDSTSASRSKVELTLPQMIASLNHPTEDRKFDNIHLLLEDFMEAIKVITPSAKREGFITVPNVSWNDIGSLFDIREELRFAILAPLKYSKEMKRLGITSPSGFLLCGPPGCGKTLIAKAIANEAGINFLSIKGPELMNMYVGESERAVRDCFQRARSSAPCVIFFDEFESICPKRSEAHEGSSGIRVVNQLLTEMDGIEERKGVFIIAASNRPDIIDPAILRPGRLDTVLYVGMPNKDDRIDILRAATKNRTSPLLSKDVNFAALADATKGFTGADLCGLVRKAAMISLKNLIANQSNMENVHVNMDHFNKALRVIRPSVSAEDLQTYDQMRMKYAVPRTDSMSQRVAVVPDF